MTEKKELLPHTVQIKQTDPQQGLTAQEVQLRMEAGLVNGIVQRAGRSEKDILRQNILTFFNLVFAVLALVLALTGSSLKNMTFLVVVFCNVVIGCYQEIRAKRAVDRLTLVAAAELKTLRDGALQQIHSNELVRDDIVVFSLGDQICADGILVEGLLYVNESLVTGEEEPVMKSPGDTLLSGSFVVTGTGKARLTKVGAEAFAARLAAEAKTNGKCKKSEMMAALDRLIHIVGYALIPVGLALFYQEFKVLQLPLRDSAEATVAALVGMIPEGLYLLTSIALAVSTIKLTGKKVLVQDMSCIEALARVDMLCLDKTGTITMPKMQVENVIPLTEDPPEKLENALRAFYADQEPENETARAMAEMFGGESDWHCSKRIPFTSQTRWSAAVFRDRGSLIVGAPQTIMGNRYGSIREAVEGWTSSGYRVLLVAQYAGIPAETLNVANLTPLALVLLTNTLRPDAPQILQYFAQQGVQIKVISGDDPITVSSVAKRAGILHAEEYTDLSWAETEEDYRRAAMDYTVFGRVRPDQKKKLILALKALGHTVAMTGDGVNDVPALQASDCGIAMAGGAQAASQVAPLVLLSGDFGAMPKIVDEGRRVINNIQRSATLFLVKNIFSLGLALITLITGWAYPIVPFHLTMISSLTIGIPAFFLAMEPNYERVKGRFLSTVIRKALPGGLTNVFTVVVAQAFMAVFSLPREEISTVCAAILAFVGMQVLYQTCKPFDKFRVVLWLTMGVALLGCFFLLPELFELPALGLRSALVLGVLMIVSVAVLRAFDWCFTAWDKLRLRIAEKKK